MTFSLSILKQLTRAYSCYCPGRTVPSCLAMLVLTTSLRSRAQCSHYQNPSQASHSLPFGVLASNPNIQGAAEKRTQVSHLGPLCASSHHPPRQIRNVPTTDATPCILSTTVQKPQHSQSPPAQSASVKWDNGPTLISSTEAPLILVSRCGTWKLRIPEPVH